MQKILLVEDDQKLARLIKSFLEEHHFAVTWLNNGDLADQYVSSGGYDLILLDVMLPGKDGFEICRSIRTKFNGPVIMVTARTNSLDQLRGLELGADDYIYKPIEPLILLARIRALLRRVPVEEASTKLLQFGKLQINKVTHSVKIAESNVNLTENEFELLIELTKRAGEILSREYLFMKLIRRDYDGIDRTIDGRVSRLRKKLGDSNESPFRIKTIWGKGYLFVEDAWE
ncbi:response regulator [Thalassotalea sp. ND16A]|uniref:response regulator n=1 Tax=Thalassotalea sp. ND16A TaxID=1535422 RepID=UPI00051A377A|nr:response regulator [Thalassotalea sp. ND16A]